jgi:putative ABC transport system permease protein
MPHSSVLAIRSLFARPLRTLLTAFSVVLGVAVILAIRIANVSTLAAVTQVFAESSGKANLVVVSASERDEGFPRSVLDRVQRTPGVEAAVPSIRAQAILLKDAASSQLDMNMLGAAAGGLTLYGIDPTVDGQARSYKLVEGRFLTPNSRTYEAVLVKDFADTKSIRVGNDLEIVTAGQLVRLRVVGLMAKEGAGVMNNGAFGVMPLRAAQQILERGSSLDQIDVIAAPADRGAPALDALKSELQTRLGDKYDVTYPAAQGQRVAQMLTGYQMGLTVFSVIAIFAGAFLIYNAFLMTVIERKREIGTLRTLGMTQGQVQRQILLEAGLIGIGGATLGIGAGILLAFGLIKGMELLLGQTVRTLMVPWDGLVLSFVIGVGATAVAALIPAVQASRVSPLEALRTRGQDREGWLARRGWLAGLLLLASSIPLFTLHWPAALASSMQGMAVLAMLGGSVMLAPAVVGLWERAVRPVLRRLYGSEGSLGSRNIQRGRLRTTLTVAALMICVAMILSIQAVTASFQQDLNTWIVRYIGGDLYVHSALKMRSDIERRLAQVDGVAAVAPVRYLDVKRIRLDGTSETLALMGVDPASYSQVTSFVFAADEAQSADMMARLAQGDAVFASSVLAEKYGLHRGDEVQLLTRRGQRTFEIAGIVVDFYNQGRVIEIGWRDLQRYFDIDDASAYLIKIAPEASPDAVRQTVNRLYGDAYHLTTDSNRDLRERAMGLLAQTSSMFDVLALIALVVAAFGIVNTMTMNVIERTRELGMLRSLGMTRGQVIKMILAEAAMMGLVGGALGVGLGLAMSQSVIHSMNSMGGFSLTYAFSPTSALAGLLAAFIVSQLAAIWPSRRAAGLRMIEAIQFE